ncbi:glycoside hydrolase family 15 protein [Pseudonocardia petroleophila]|uniref:Glycoside hydrolase family 15 protein n=2 Tax=Pseudonocardia petroleophila TaxID=37331 RepID=A0A7G7MR71_9PSEU|nr:glycoside hydrolase family 15 protein [Pseudonocardia petroleophila]
MGSPPHVLREYALLADGERGALIGPRGDIAWLCAPRWDSDAVFSSLVGGGGSYAVTPAGRFVWGGYYEPGTLIWRSRWVTDTGIVECREALAFPGDRHRTVVLRRIVAVAGDARVEVVCAPAARFGREPLREPRRGDGGCWEARSGELRMRWTGAPDARVDGDRLLLTCDLPEGGHRDLVLEIADTPLGGVPPDPDLAWAGTEAAWAGAVPPLDASIAPRDARHAYAVLRGLTGSGGGMVAAATMGLPERAAQGRDYDYRYVWIRDQCYAGQAVAVDGPHPLLDDAVRFVAERVLADGPELKPAYTVTGGAVPDQRPLDLPGYPGGRDVLGNHVNAQFQLDAFGEALLLFAAAARHDRLDTEHRQALRATVAAIETRWGDPDAGIWELDDRRWAHSRLTCVAGLRAIAGAGAAPGDAARWSALADAILADTADCVHPSGRWQRAPDDPRVDAALLLPAIRGALPAADARSVATVAAVQEELAEEGYVYRFRQDARPLGEAEGAFGLCGFLMALAAHQQGDPVAAATWFERNRAACGPPGLFSEEYDVAQRQLRGNLPQAFVHALMLESSLRLASDR